MGNNNTVMSGDTQFFQPAAATGNLVTQFIRRPDQPPANISNLTQSAVPGAIRGCTLTRIPALRDVPASMQATPLPQDIPEPHQQ